jgi:hypothetical protein
MGDHFSNISGSILINRSLVGANVKKFSDAGDGDVADLIKKVADAVQASGNKEAAEIFDQLNEELQKPEPRKSLLRRSWDNLVSALPSVTAIAGAVGAIAKLLG